MSLLLVIVERDLTIFYEIRDYCLDGWAPIVEVSFLYCRSVSPFLIFLFTDVNILRIALNLSGTKKERKNP